MRYFTREWFQRMQDSPSEDEESSGKSLGEDEALSPRDLCSEAAARYQYYLSSIAPRLSGDVAKLECLNLHDAKIVNVSYGPNSFTLTLRDFFSRKHYNRELTISFDGGNGAAGLQGVEGQDIIYDEVDVVTNGGFKYCALLDRTEFSVCFETVHIQARDISS